VTEFQLWGKVDIPSMFGPRFERVNIFYSSPEYYTKCKYEETQSSRAAKQRQAEVPTDEMVQLLSVKQDDFFPYSDCEHCFWAGFFTSRTGFKRLERAASSFLLAARQIDSMLDFTGNEDSIQCDQPLHELEDATGVAQHHDGVSGTAKQHVADDYARRVQAGVNHVSKCTLRKLKRLFLGANASDFLSDLSYCQLLNETICNVSQVSWRLSVGLGMLTR
jgi:hypothetical protein